MNERGAERSRSINRRKSKRCRAEGHAEGQKKGMDALAALNRVLLKEKRYDDLARASSDAAYRQKLLEDLGIE
ncbi:MAG: hypothetical protein SPL46_02545 [Selenomonadaceae bacterium]|jgi:hypothetical protein|nr:hypothetical protein [Selenomonas sp.]MDY6298881.1 hypothetical protein [Selenomonadaceae bacterium]